MRYAIVENNKVVNVILWDGVSPLGITGEKINISDLQVKPGVNWDYINGEFIDNRPPITDSEDDEPSEPKEEEEGES